jgi:gamma-tubulin complex component 2
MQHTAGDPSARALYGTLLRAAGRPYVEMLQQWTRTGTLTDPYEEFCVKESRFINRGTLEMDYTDEYWERRYTVSRSLAIHRAEFRPKLHISCVMVRHSVP